MLPDLSTALNAAPELLGWTLVHHTPAGNIGGIITETEAYAMHDEASHSFKGQTKRNGAMFLEAGTIYMYFIYGMHWCLNIVTGNAGTGEAVLIRALKPTIGIELMKLNRHIEKVTELCKGPASLVKALGICPEINGLHILKTNLELIPPIKTFKNIETSKRVGITKNTDTLWRFRLIE